MLGRKNRLFRPEYVMMKEVMAGTRDIADLASFSGYTWSNLSNYMDEEEIRRFKDKVNWLMVSSNGSEFTDEFYDEFKEKLSWPKVCVFKHLTVPTLRRFKDYLSWEDVSSSQVLDKDFIRDFADKVDWKNILHCQVLTEDFLLAHDEYIKPLKEVYINPLTKLSEAWIEAHLSNLNMEELYYSRRLSEGFVRKHMDCETALYALRTQVLSQGLIMRIKELRPYDEEFWKTVSRSQPLSESFMREHITEIDLNIVSVAQPLSENFMRDFKNKLNWLSVVKVQRLSEVFINEMGDVIDYRGLADAQKLTEDFLWENRKYLDWEAVTKYQRLSPEFIMKIIKDSTLETSLSLFKIAKYQYCDGKMRDFLYNFTDGGLGYDFHRQIEDSWLYKPTEEKKAAVIATGEYECGKDSFIAYKAIRADRWSIHNFQYHYLPGETYEAWCDCSDNENSFGLSCGTEKFAISYKNPGGTGIIVKVRVRYEDVGRVVHGGQKIRAFRLEALD